MNSKNFDALVIKSINFKDSDKIYTLLAKGLGKSDEEEGGKIIINCSKGLKGCPGLNTILLKESLLRFK